MKKLVLLSSLLISSVSCAEIQVNAKVQLNKEVYTLTLNHHDKIPQGYTEVSFDRGNIVIQGYIFLDSITEDGCMVGLRILHKNDNGSYAVISHPKMTISWGLPGRVEIGSDEKVLVVEVVAVKK